jgi:hypothetical protein
MLKHRLPWQGVTGPTLVVTNAPSPYWGYPFTEYGYPPFPFTYMSWSWTERDICRVGLTPGKYGPDLGGCLYPYGGIENYQPGDAGFDVCSWIYMETRTAGVRRMRTIICLTAG